MSADSSLAKAGCRPTNPKFVTMKNPSFGAAVLMTESPELAAQLSIALSERGKYMVVLDPPRLGRADAKAEVTRRTNAIAHTGIKKIILAGTPPQVRASLAASVPSSFIRELDDLNDNHLKLSGIRLRKGEPIKARIENVGASLLLALRSKRQLEFTSHAPELRYVASISSNLVICEDSNHLSQVIAANYAYAIGAGLQLISSPTESFVREINERFYNSQSDEFSSTTTKLQDLANELRHTLGDICLTGVRSITVFTTGVPWGFSLQEVPTTHLFVYPDLGLSVVHGIAASLKDSEPMRVVAMVDPGKVESAEVVKVGRRLVERGALITAFRKERADIHNISLMLDLIPYDLLFIATHCGDVSGFRETYNFKDSSGGDRTLVLDMAIQVTPVLRDGKIEVKAYEKFVSIDGVPWEDKEQRMLVVGSALQEFYKKRLGERTPTSRIKLNRIVGSAALAMVDGNLLATPSNAGANGYPFIFNNACVSWHELAGRFMFGGARGYIGTLIEVSDSEAQEIAMGVLDKYFGRPIAEALWSTQKEISGGGIRRPYVMVGVHFQRLRSTFERPHAHILNRLNDGLSYWSKQLQKLSLDNEDGRRSITDRIEFLQSCIKDFTTRQLE